jgi:hypothetical protein
MEGGSVSAECSSNYVLPNCMFILLNIYVVDLLRHFTTLCCAILIHGLFCFMIYFRASFFLMNLMMLSAARHAFAVSSQVK